MPSKCFVCGKRPAVIDGWCAEDWNREHMLLSLPVKFEVVVCSKCKRAKLSGKWQDWEPRLFLKSKSKISGKLDEFIVTERNGKFVVRATGMVERGTKPKTEEHIVTIKFNRVTCPDCSRAAGGYYEAVLQLRGEVPANVITFIERELAKIFYKDPRAFCSMRELKEGTDIRVGSVSAAKKLAELLKEKYRPETKTSYQLVGRKDGRDIHRAVISLRFKRSF